MKKLYLFLVSIGFFAACSDPSMPIDATVSPCASKRSVTRTVVNGNPYSIANMRTAFSELVNEGVISEDESINNVIYVTHRYIKFTPESEDEVGTLLSNTALDLYNYPIDNNENIQHDENTETEELEEGDPEPLPVFYASVPVDYILPYGITYEILEELYIPDEEYDDSGILFKKQNGVRASSVMIEDIVRRSFEITGNEDDYEYDEGMSPLGNSRWYPSGCITAYDDVVNGPVPLCGITVRARRWFTTHKADTDANGNFSCSESFKRPANYSFKWEGDKWDIRDGYIWQAYYNGPKQKGPWNLYITDGKSLRYSAIYRAAYRFYVGDACGLSRPNNSRKEKISYFHRSGGSINGDYYPYWETGILPDIRIYGKSLDEWRPVSGIFSTTCHELGHLSHYTNTLIEPITPEEDEVSLFSDTENVVIESWARCVQYVLSMQEYEDLDVMDNYQPLDTRFRNPQYWIPDIGLVLDNRINGQIEIGHRPPTVPIFEYWPSPDDNKNFQSITKYVEDYTPIFIDLLDDINQYEYYYSFNISLDENDVNLSLYPDDDVYHIIPVADLEEIVFSNIKMTDIWEDLLEFIESYYVNDSHLIDNCNKLFEEYGHER